MAIAIPHRRLHDDAQSGVHCAPMRIHRWRLRVTDWRLWSSWLRNEMTRWLPCQRAAVRHPRSRKAPHPLRFRSSDASPAFLAPCSA